MSTAPETGQWRQKRSRGGAGSKHAGGNNNNDNKFDNDNYLGGIGAHTDDDESSRSNNNNSSKEDEGEGLTDDFAEAQVDNFSTLPPDDFFAPHASLPKKSSKVAKKCTPKADFGKQLATKNKEVAILKNRLTDAEKALAEAKKTSTPETPSETHTGKKKSHMNDAMAKRINNVVLQKTSKTHPFVPSSEFIDRACGMVMDSLGIKNLIGDSDKVLANRDNFVATYQETCCKAFNQARTYVQQRMHKAIMSLLHKAKDLEKEVPTADEIKEMCLRTYKLDSVDNIKKAIFYIDQLLPAISRGK